MGNRHAKIIPDNEIDSVYEHVYGDDEYKDDEYKDEGHEDEGQENQLVLVPYILHLFDSLYKKAHE